MSYKKSIIFFQIIIGIQIKKQGRIVLSLIIYHLMVGMHGVLLVLIMVAVVSIESLELRFYDEERIKTEWRVLEEQLQEADEIVIHYSGLTQGTLLKILSKRLPKLKVLSFGSHHFNAAEPASLFNVHPHQYLTHKLLAAIFNSSYIENLVELNLIGTNIDDNYWNFVDQIDWSAKKLRLERMLLGNNYIGSKGLSKIAKMLFGSLVEIDISNNFLDSSAVTSLFTILCSNKSSNCSKKLSILDVSSTNIQSNDLLRLLHSLDPNSLTSLNISNINLHQRNKYHQGFDLTVYEELSKITFPNLRILQMNDMALDATVLAVLKNWKFQSVESLSLHSNFIDDSSLKLWVTQGNFPKLKKLILATTDIRDAGLAFIVKQHRQLRQLNLGMTLLSRTALTTLQDYDTSQLEKLFLKSLNIDSKVLRDLFARKDFSGLKEFSLTNNKQISDLFEYLPWNKLQKLEKLILTDCEIGESFSLMIEKNQTLLPKLKFMMFNGTGLDSTAMKTLLTASSILFPSLEYVNLIPEFVQPLNFTELSQVKTKRNLQADIGYVIFRRGSDKFQLLQVKSLSWLALYSSKQDLILYLQPITEHFINFTHNLYGLPLSDQLKHSIAIEMSAIFCIDSLKIITITKIPEWQIFTEWLIISNITSLPQLMTIIINIPIEVQLLSKLLKQVQMPLLRNLRISIKVTKMVVSFQKLVAPMQNLTQLVDLRVRINYAQSFSRVKNYNTFFNQLKYPFLMQLDLSQNYLQIEQIGGILYNHTPTLRFLTLHSNFVEHSLLRMIGECQMTLKSLDISFISFTVTEFAYLGKANLAFLADLKADKCDITDAHVTALIAANNGSIYPLFPKLGLLSLNENQLHQDGVRALLQLSLFQLTALRLSRNSIPHLLNILLTYTNKINEIIAVGIEIYALDRKIQPISTRRIKIFGIQTFSFSDSDYEILGSLNFNRLILSQIETRNVYECKTLEHLLHISSKAKVSWVTFKGERKRLNSTCLNHQKYRNFMSEVEELGLWQATDQTYIPEFAELLLASKKNWRQILIQNMRMPPSIFLKINPSSLDQIQTLYLGNSHFDDKGFSRILQSPLNNLQFFRICDTDVTLKSISLLANRTFRSLQHFEVSGIEIGEQGLAIISSIKARKLKILVLNRCGINSLKQISKMQFPEVNQLELRSNSFPASQFIEFLANLNRTAWKSLWRIDVRGATPNESERQRIDQLQKEMKLDIGVDNPHYIDPQNSAFY